ncbi:MAG: phytanoyl-CoA dioxygenase family protein [Planctomycetes bacterium]|nr:phytanoyl-CoA dioxygenase family protein [Planctomycetota bacterium]
MELNFRQKAEFYEQGYTVLRGVVPKIMIDQALHEINHSLGEGLPKEEIQTLRARSYCSELQGTELFKGLFQATPAWELAESLVGKGNLMKSGGAQVALRFPGSNAAMQKPPNLSCHLDGMHSPHNGVPKDGKFHNFTALGVVLLSRLDGPYQGNFTVWPGTHRQFEKFFREHGPDYLNNEGMPKIDYPEPVMCEGEPGDVVLTHYMVAHTAAPNHSPHVRYATIYRLNHVRRSAERGGQGGNYPDVMTDIWKEWDGIREIIPEVETNRREVKLHPVY